MFNLFKRKPRIIAFNAYRPPESESQQVTLDNPCEVLSFKANPHPSGKPASNLENPGHCKLYFIWDHMP
jgi:hypothetical protein